MLLNPKVDEMSKIVVEGKYLINFKNKKYSKCSNKMTDSKSRIFWKPRVLDFFMSRITNSGLVLKAQYTRINLKFFKFIDKDKLS